VVILNVEGGELLMVKVICKYCTYEKDNKCSKKKSTVKLNKRRRCNLYKENEEKIKALFEKPVKRKSRVVYPSSWAAVKGQLKRSFDLQQFQTTVSKHPLTGDLSEFVDKDSAVVSGGAFING